MGPSPLKGVAKSPGPISDEIKKCKSGNCTRTPKARTSACNETVGRRTEEGSESHEGNKGRKEGKEEIRKVGRGTRLCKVPRLKYFSV